MPLPRRPSQVFTGLLVLLVLGLAQPGHAVPSFARQTGMDCSACHTVFPELTNFGRRFKLSGYTVGSVKWISATDADGNTRVQLSSVPPVGGMFQATHQFVANNPLTYTAAGSDGAGTNQLPAQFSLFYAGELTPKMGAFVQVTYDPGAGTFQFDNSDIRYADDIDLFDTDLIYGGDINNNPTVQDVWNSTPAWGFPYVGAAGAQVVGPMGTPMIESLAGTVASLGAYAYWNDLVYAEVSDYRSADPLSSASALQGAAPYWRLAIQQSWDEDMLEAGTFGMSAQTYPQAAPIGFPRDNFTDVGLDAMAQHVGERNQGTLKGSWIQEEQAWNASNINTNPAGTTAQSTGLLRQLRLDATYYYLRMFGASVGYFDTNGTSDGLLYAAGPVTGSADGSPNNNGFVYELNYVPWYNTKFTLQYTDYHEFNGARTNYDGSGRNAWDNNTLLLMGWFAY